MVLNVYAADNIVLIYIMQNMIEHQGEVDEDSKPLSVIGRLLLTDLT